MREEVNVTAQQLDPGEDEFVAAGLEKEEGRVVGVSLVKESPVRFECAFERVVELPGNPPMGTVSCSSFRSACPFYLAILTIPA